MNNWKMAKTEKTEDRTKEVLISSEELDFLSFKLLKKSFGILIGIVTGLASIFAFLGINYINQLKDELEKNKNSLVQVRNNYSRSIDSLVRVVNDKVSKIETTQSFMTEYNNETKAYMRSIFDSHINNTDKLIDKVGQVGSLKEQYNNLVDEGSRNNKAFEDLKLNNKNDFKNLSKFILDDIEEIRNQLLIQNELSSELLNRLLVVEDTMKTEYVYLSQDDPTSFSRLARVKLNYKDINDSENIGDFSIVNVNDKTQVKKWNRFAENQVGYFRNSYGNFEVSIVYLESQKPSYTSRRAYQDDFVWIQIQRTD